MYNNSTKKILFTFYLFSAVFGLYNLFAWAYSDTPLRERIHLGFIWYDLIIIFSIISLFILSFIIAFKVAGKEISKIHLIYSLYFPSRILLVILLNRILYFFYDFDTTLSILESSRRYYGILYLWDVLFPLYMLHKEFPALSKIIVPKLKDFFYWDSLS